MTSSTSSPFKLVNVNVRDNNRYIMKSGTHYARFLLTRAETVATVTSWHDALNVLCKAELAAYSWLTDADKIGSTMNIGDISARVEFDISTVFSAQAPDMQDALMFACNELNPMLESLTTLFGISNNIDIVVEHGLRPVQKMLQGLVQPRPSIKTPFRRFT